MAKENPEFFIFLAGFASVFLVSLLSPFLIDIAPIVPFVLVTGAFIASGIIGCVLIPQQPYRAARIVVGGAFIGITLHIILFPKIGGFERNLFPLEIATITLWAAICAFTVAKIKAST